MQLFTIIGNPVAHSFSPLMHNYAFKALDIEACYTRTLLEDGDTLKETFFSLRLNGANVTVPHKEAAFHACDEVRGFAKKVQSVNTLILEEGKLIGYNTDADGFIYAINTFNIEKKALVLGAGGTARALSLKLQEEGYDVQLLNRSGKRFEHFLNKGIPCATYDDFDASVPYPLLVNTTSAGLEDDSLPAPKALLEQLLLNTKAAFDAIYGKETPFITLLKSKNIRYKDGLDMLLGQGVLANALFTKHAFTLGEIEKNLRKGLELRLL